MESNNNPLRSLNNYWQVIAGILVVAIAIGAYMERQRDTQDDLVNFKSQMDIRFNNLESKVTNVEDQAFKELEQRVDDLEEKAAYDQGYKDALKQFQK